MRTSRQELPSPPFPPPCLSDYQPPLQTNPIHKPQNQLVWVAGEPAFLKIWLRAPAAGGLDDAMDAEEGFSPDLAAAAVEALLRRCGVETEAFKRARLAVWGLLEGWVVEF